MEVEHRVYLIIRNVTRDDGTTDESLDKGIETATDKLTEKIRKYFPTTWAVDYPVIYEEYINSKSFLEDDYAERQRGAQNYLRDALNWLQAINPEKAELVIRGHGSRMTQVAPANRVGGVLPRDLAAGLVRLGFNSNCRINITGCNLGRSPTFAKNEVGLGYKVGQEFEDALNAAEVSDVGKESFAGRFQRRLHEYGKLTNEIHARTLPVLVGDDGHKKTRNSNEIGVDEVNTPNGKYSYTHSQLRSKIIFTIAPNGEQTMKFAYDPNDKSKSYLGEIKADINQI